MHNCKITYSVFVLLLTFLSSFAGAQEQNVDSIHVNKALNDLFTICEEADSSRQEFIDKGLFYKAAPMVVYRGKNKKRRWKDVANYSEPKEKEAVDAVCLWIKEAVTISSDITMGKFKIHEESIGILYVQQVTFIINDKENKTYFTFLKIGDQFALSEID
ncbi:MAG: hypothetical protein IIA45_13475 [Bacteroidetes bacterium]|nr:hypothetical protein [Bacteroidota bacterium]